MSLVHYVTGIILFLMAVAALSRVLSMEHIADYISNAFGTLTNLFNGAFK